MNHYSVSIYDQDSWRKLENKRIVATNIGLACYRAYKIFKAQFKGRRITTITIKAQKYGNNTKHEGDQKKV